MQTIRDWICVVGASAVLLLSESMAAEPTVSELEQRCEAAREAKIKPLRDAEVAKCKADKRNDAEYCERFWKDYGDARRAPNGTYIPRLFNDLPDCVAAEKARQQQNR